MAKKALSKLWVFRYPLEHDRGGQYVLWRGTKPRKNRSGNWPTIPGHHTFHTIRTNWLLQERDFEAIFPMYSLPLGGGPVEIRFADEA